MEQNLFLILLGIGNALTTFASAVILGKWSDLAMRRWFKIFLGVTASVLAMLAAVNIIILTVNQTATGLLWSGILQLTSSAAIVLVLAITGRKQGNRRKQEESIITNKAYRTDNYDRRTFDIQNPPLSEILTNVEGELEYITQNFDRRLM